VSGVTTVSVSASDNVGVVQVNLLVDAVFVKAMKTTPYNFTLDTRTYSNGSHTLFAKIYDAAGNKTVTSSIAVTFQN
jgi:Bacterial Ig domain